MRTGDAVVEGDSSQGTVDAPGVNPVFIVAHPGMKRQIVLRVIIFNIR